MHVRKLFKLLLTMSALMVHANSFTLLNLHFRLNIYLILIPFHMIDCKLWDFHLVINRVKIFHPHQILSKQIWLKHPQLLSSKNFLNVHLKSVFLLKSFK